MSFPERHFFFTKIYLRNDKILILVFTNKDLARRYMENIQKYEHSVKRRAQTKMQGGIKSLSDTVFGRETPTPKTRLIDEDGIVTPALTSRPISTDDVAAAICSGRENSSGTGEDAVSGVGVAGDTVEVSRQGQAHLVTRYHGGDGTGNKNHRVKMKKLFHNFIKFWAPLGRLGISEDKEAATEC